MQSRQPSYSAGKINARRRNPDLPTGDVHHDANNWFQSSVVEQHPVTFKNIYEMQVTANVFLPKDSAETVFPALIIGAPIGAVKEQAANLYAIKLAEQGFVTVSFDQSAWGGSNGALRNAIAPTLYAENFSAATDYLTTLDCVANDRIGLIAIGSAGGFALNALKIDARIKALATINLTDMGAIVREQRDALGGNALIEESSRSRTLEIAGQATTYAHGVPEELDELKQEKRELKRQLQLADSIVKEDLYTAYYAVSENEEVVADRDVEIPGMEEDMLVERTEEAFVEPDANVVVMNPYNIQNEIGRQKEQADRARKQQSDLDGIGIPEPHNSPDVNVVRVGESMTDVTDKSEFVETRETEPVDKAGWIVRRISELGGYENVSDSVKADVFGFDIADVSRSIRLFSDVMKKLGIKLDGDELYVEFQRIYDESVGRDVDKERAEDKMWNRGRGR